MTCLLQQRYQIKRFYCAYLLSFFWWFHIGFVPIDYGIDEKQEINYIIKII